MVQNKIPKTKIEDVTKEEKQEEINNLSIKEQYDLWTDKPAIKAPDVPLPPTNTQVIPPPPVPGQSTPLPEVGGAIPLPPAPTQKTYDFSVRKQSIYV